MILGTSDGAKVRIDLPTLVITKLLIQANSGGGKSWVIRRILEQTFGKIQHVVIDLEGEFSSLREKFDYILAGRGGDTAANPKTAKLLARRLLELHASCILDLSELKFHERMSFVRLFLESLVDSPKELWHPALVVVDEAHIFCPEKAKNESADAVIDLATRGRKRGFCAVLATQRLSKLHKDAAAELNNKLIGRTGLDVDMKRAADDLGFGGREQMLSLRNLEPGEWFAFGPAISRGVIKVEVGDVETTHPKVGSKRLIAPPPPTEKVKKILSKIQDLPKEAEQEIQSVASLNAEIARLRREIAARPSPTPAVQERIREIPVLGKDDASRLERTAAKLAHLQDRLAQAQQTVVSELGSFRDALVRFQKLPPPRPAPLPTPKPSLPNADRMMAARASDGHPPALGKCEVAILQTLTCHGPCDMRRLALLSGYRTSGGFRNSISRLRSLGLLEGANNGTMSATDDGSAQAGAPELPPPGMRLVDYWMNHQSLGQCERAVFSALVDAYPNGLSLSELAETAGYQLSGGFRNSISRLRTAGLLVGRNIEAMSANSHLFGKG